MRLVDIDDVRDGIKDSLGINIMLVYSGDKWKDILDSIPTAYDIDKVVKEILDIDVDLFGNKAKQGVVTSLSEYRAKIVNIVKRGGANDF